MTQTPLRNLSSPSKLVKIATGAALLWAARAIYLKFRRIDLNDRLVLITGGSRGLGLALAREFASRGARVAICGRQEKHLTKAQAQLQREGLAVETFRCDVTKPKEVSRLIARVVAQMGPLDILVNNAGEISVGPLESMGLADFHSSMNINFYGALHTVMAALPSMVANGAGHIVNIASIGGKVPVPHLLPYTASKFALVGFSQGLGAEVAKHGIKVTTVCPGLMRTGSPRHAKFKGNSRAEYAWFILGDSFPGLSMPADRAARRIVEACVLGKSEVVLSLVAKTASKAYELAPNFIERLLKLVNLMLPAAPSAKYRGLTRPNLPPHYGYQSESKITKSFLTELTRKAEKTYNQLSLPA